MNETTLKTSQASDQNEIGTKKMTFEVDLVSAKKDESPEQFKLRVMRAQMAGHDYVEANEELCQYFNPDGLGKYNKYFTFSASEKARGLRVYLAGTKEAHDAKEKVQMHQRLHHDDTFFEGR